MAYKYYDFECPNCSFREERMTKEGDVELCTAVHDGVACETPMVRMPPAPLSKFITKGNHDYAQRERERCVSRRGKRGRCQVSNACAAQIRRQRAGRAGKRPIGCCAANQNAIGVT